MGAEAEVPSSVHAGLPLFRRLRLEGLPHRVISRFCAILPVEKQSRALAATRELSDPGVFVGKSPGLDGPGENFSAISLHHAPDVFVKQFSQLLRTVMTIRKPLWIVDPPTKGYARGPSCCGFRQTPPGGQRTQS
jgi:hypothetical protein